jgi:outer membrane biosynthesis protein TonB
MDVYIYTEVTRKVQGEDVQLLQPFAVLEDFESEEAALEALVDEYPDYLGTEFIIFTEEPQRITVEPPPEQKYSFKRRGANGDDAEEEEAEPEEAEEEYEDEEPEEEEYEEEEPEEDEEEEEEPEPEPKPRAKKRPAKKAAPKSKPAAKKKAAAKKRPASAKRPAGARAGTRTGSSKRTPFTRNPASAE